MNAPMVTGRARRVSLLVVGVSLALVTAPVSAQVKSSMPGPRRAGSPTPMERSFGRSPGGGSGGRQNQMPVQRAPRQSFDEDTIVGGPNSRSGSYVSGSGLTVNGVYSDDNLTVGFHLGSPVGSPVVDRTCSWYPNGAYWCYPYNCYRGFGWYTNYWNGYYNGYYDNSNQRYSVIDGALVLSVSQPAPTPAPAVAPPPPPTEAELAAALLKSGDIDGALARYRATLKADPSDAASMRGLGLALLAKGEPESGVAMIAMAYRTDPALADRAIPSRELFASPEDLRAMLQKSVAFANRIKSASSWLTVAILMQGEGRDEQAGRMIKRAAELGLDAGLAKRFRISLGV